MLNAVVFCNKEGTHTRRNGVASPAYLSFPFQIDLPCPRFYIRVLSCDIVVSRCEIWFPIFKFELTFYLLCLGFELILASMRVTLHMERYSRWRIFRHKKWSVSSNIGIQISHREATMSYCNNLMSNIKIKCEHEFEKKISNFSGNIIIPYLVWCVLILNCNGHQHSAAPLLFFAVFAFWLTAVLSFVCNGFLFLFAAHQSFLFAAVSSLVCSGFLFCLQFIFFACSRSFLFGAFVFFCCLFCLQRVPCGPLYHLITHTYFERDTKEGEKK